MSKMRVHELAKELGMDNKELMDILGKKNVEVKSHMSSLEENVVEEIRNEAGKPEKKKEEEAAPKKKNLAFVIRPQNSKNVNRIQGNRPAARGQRPAGTARPAQGAAGSRPARPAQAGRPAGKTTQTMGRPTGAQTQGNSAQQTGTSSQGSARPAGASSQGSTRPAGVSSSGNTRPAGVSSSGNTRPVGVSSQGNARPAENTSSESRRQGGINTQGQNRPKGYGTGTNRNGGEAQQGGRPSGNTSRRDTRQGNFGQENSRPSRPGRDGRDGRNTGGNRRFDNQGQRPIKGDSRREDRDSLSMPMMEQQQKNQRSKVKDKEKDYKKKELRDEAFESKGKKSKKQKVVAEVKKPQPKPAEKKEEQIKQIVIPEVLTIKELADKMKIVPSVIVKKLFLQGKVVTVNQEIDFETAEEIAMEFEVLCEKEEVVDVIEELLKEEEEDESTMVKRPPVVCVMGHVDHGKTSLLDAIRHTNVIGREAGGITQHIGAYVVEANGEKITFLDTPGHEAFTAMRMRGANSTDIAILVVAADDGVMPQTVEAINHAKAAGIEIIVAINKIDKPSANIERVKQELTEYELIPEDWGGSTIFVPVSAHTKEGIPELLEMILLTAEVMELKANPNRFARGLVIEAELDKGKGSVATVLVQKGTLHVGDAIAAGSAHGRVRAMMDDKGRRVKEAGPSQPVEILGLNDVPNAGEVFVGCESEKEARSFAETFIAHNKVKLLDDTKSKMSLDDLFTQIQEGNLKELNIVVKADVQGSVEAIKQSLLKLSNDEVVIKIIHGGVGAINESDVILASASNAIIIGFNVRPDATAKEIADREGVDLRLYRVIYNAIEDVEAAMKGMLDPVFEEKTLGHAEVRQTFKASGVGTIAGAYVKDGIFERNCSVRLIRDGIVVFDGPLASLKRFKDDVKEVKAGYECGFVFENYNDIKEGDEVEAYKMVETERK
ncbi:translation initiation factor IF-2 [Faecalicatena acetigenes]|uniref:Translation initiation factor IF-2 n=1 Tax=Faecalicatena acetigenes TaxID=2981790 RepID=A0ABT2TD33_9FIRM|nr:MULTISPECIES: translation initiation factor IF-2 [Lachnospiraceae]MCU6748195.1 translation initiation factor IF-2 [Faecalicatena acetigenes]SCI30574.1 Translation initiation factor IF-2 [uncultured Clostridium sp.]